MGFKLVYRDERQGKLHVAESAAMYQWEITVILSLIKLHSRTDMGGQWHQLQLSLAWPQMIVFQNGSDRTWFSLHVPIPGAVNHACVDKMRAHHCGLNPR